MFLLTSKITSGYYSIMDFRTYYDGLTPTQKKNYAKRTGFALSYIQGTLMPKRFKTGPKKETMIKLANGTGKKVSYADVVNYFYG